MINEEQRAALEKFQKDPALFFREVLGIDTLEAYQEEILTKIANNERVCISACHDVGKSYTLARVVLWYVTCFPYCKVITTAPTFNQVKNILWAEIRAAYARSKFPLGGKMNLTEWQVTKDGDWFAIGFTPRNELSGDAGQGTQSSFQGFHAPYILVVFDEATGIPHNIWTMAEGILTSANVKFVAIGNPTSRSSEFYKCFLSPAWAKVKLNCFNSPNLIANGVRTIEDLLKEINAVQCMSDSDAQLYLKAYVAPKPYLLSLKWVVEMGLPSKWGIDHPLFVSKALGEFPTDSDGTLMPLNYVEEAQRRVAWPTATDRKCIGVDVARFGSDATVLTATHGAKFIKKKQLNKKSTDEVVGEIIAFNRECFEGNADIIVIDETGVGGGVVDLCRAAQKDDTIKRSTYVRGVQFGAGVECAIRGCEHKECERSKYVNLKARMFGLLAADLKSNLTLPNEDVYLDELPTILYRYDAKGRMYIESKDEFKKRTGRKSPDHADSLALANFGRYDETTSGSFTAEYAQKNSWAKPYAASLGDRKKW
jgi:phage terminase large subunit